MNKVKNISIVIALFLSLTSVFGFIAKADSRYAKAQDVVELSERLEAKLKADRIKAIQEEMWRMEDRWHKRFVEDKGRDPENMEEVITYMNIKSEDAKTRYRELKTELEKLQKKEE